MTQTVNARHHILVSFLGGGTLSDAPSDIGRPVRAYGSATYAFENGDDHSGRLFANVVQDS